MADAEASLWGGAAGKLNTNGTELLVFGKQFGNVFIGVQPTFGYEGDPMRLLFSRSASPHHGFAAYYTFLERIFKARGRPRHCLVLATAFPSVLAVRLQQDPPRPGVKRYRHGAWFCMVPGITMYVPVCLERVWGACSNKVPHERRYSIGFVMKEAGARVCRRTRCCTSGRTGRWSSCRASRWA